MIERDRLGAFIMHTLLVVWSRDFYCGHSSATSFTVCLRDFYYVNTPGTSSVTRDQLGLWRKALASQLTNVIGKCERRCVIFPHRIKLWCDRSNWNCPELTFAVNIKGAKSIYRRTSIHMHNNGEFLSYLPLSFSSNSENVGMHTIRIKIIVFVARANNVNRALLMLNHVKILYYSHQMH